ncbi:AlpA family transcriptional regulator [Hydrogenophaga sp. IBVHS2]|uniref:helix-turn-helix transcriptional regulator n=1 Tax=Hydrogenophaga sp. IBVHS2 TaxID=1985170 RepID=UPI000A2D567A|nr:AlpA family phage regulatory protein [Hydrogenophaga sp. IBVHS2]OSZ66102.1 hypothetical protein CAP38_08800 [Hydrogenophaga sp. IBVHS2]
MLQTLSANIHPETRLRLEAVESLVGIKKTKLYDLIKLGQFPAPEKLSPRCSRWRAGDVLAHLEARRGAAHV